MNKNETIKGKQKRRDKNLYFMVLTSLGGLGMVLFAYYKFTMEGECTFGGSKLSFVFAFICEYFGNIGVGVIFLFFGIVLLKYSWGLLGESKKI